MDSIIQSMSQAHIYDLEQTRYFGAPTLPAHEPGFVYTLHRHHEPGSGGPRTTAAGFIYTAEHSGTHIDALSHQAENLFMYGGREVTPQVQTPTGFTELGVETIAAMVSRGILLDVAGYRGVDWIESDQPITGDELQAVTQHQGTTIHKGDAILVRTGNGARWKNPSTYLAGGGVRADASQWLASQQVATVGADNSAWDTVGEVDPGLNMVFPGHLILLVRHGIYIIENLFLEDLARDRMYEFLFICLPLKMQGVTGSPVRPIAVVSQNESNT